MVARNQHCMSSCNVGCSHARLQSLLLAIQVARLQRRYMCCVIAFVNTKGGVGKSFLATSLSLWLSDQGFRIALIDADDQQTSTRWISDVSPNFVDSFRLSESGENLRSEELRVRINALKNAYDFIVVDTKGSAGLTTSAAVIKSDIACIPIQPSAADIWPLEHTLTTVKLSQEARRGAPRSLLILNQTNHADVGARQIRSLAKEHGIEVAATPIKRLKIYRDSPGLRIAPTRLTDRRNVAAAQQLESLFNEIISTTGENQFEKTRCRNQAAA